LRHSKQHQNLSLSSMADPMTIQQTMMKNNICVYIKNLPKHKKWIL
jgi:hypothetical protein